MTDQPNLPAIASLLFELTEHIPEGDYLKSMNDLMKADKMLKEQAEPELTERVIRAELFDRMKQEIRYYHVIVDALEEDEDDPNPFYLKTIRRVQNYISTRRTGEHHRVCIYSIYGEYIEMKEQIDEWLEEQKELDEDEQSPTYHHVLHEVEIEGFF